MNLLIGSLTIGFILSLLALGVYISFRIFSFADLTADGSFVFGAAVTARLLAAGMQPASATLIGALAGGAAGLATGVMATRFKVNGLLAGILTMTALYSVNLHVMGRSNLPLLNLRTLSGQAETLAARMFGAKDIPLFGWSVNTHDLVMLSLTAAIAAAAGLVLFFFFRTRLGVAMRAAGDNAQMVRSLGGDTDRMLVLGLALSNGLIAFSGALLAQYQGFADVQMGIGMLVWGLAGVIIGGALVRTNSMGFAIAGAVMGSLLFRLLVAVALRWGLNPNDLKLVTALFVLATLVMPGALERFGRRRKGGAANA